MIWALLLRPSNGDIHVTEVWTLQELGGERKLLDLRLRSNPAMRLITLRLPPGTTHEQLLQAVTMLTEDERYKLYNYRSKRSKHDAASDPFRNSEHRR
jgi:hypothetical protein